MQVKWWNTINEPKEIACGYGMKRHAPNLKLEAYGGDYLAGHNVLKAHAKAYHIYDKEFRARQKGTAVPLRKDLVYTYLTQRKYT